MQVTKDDNVAIKDSNVEPHTARWKGSLRAIEHWGSPILHQGQ